MYMQYNFLWKNVTKGYVHSIKVSKCTLWMIRVETHMITNDIISIMMENLSWDTDDYKASNFIDNLSPIYCSDVKGCEFGWMGQISSWFWSKDFKKKSVEITKSNVKKVSTYLDFSTTE